MSQPEPAPNTNAVLLVLLLLCVAVLVYLDWRRAGEIDNLHARIDNLPQAAPLPLRPHAEQAARTITEPAAAPVPAASAAPVPPAPAPERTYSEGDVIRDPLPGRDGGANGMPEKTDVHPLLRAVLQAHGDA